MITESTQSPQSSAGSTALRPEIALKIAKAQKWVLWTGLINLLLLPVPFVLIPALIILVPLQLYHVYKLAKNLAMGPPLLWCAGVFVPVISAFLLLIQSQLALFRLRQSGFRVGLMGADLDDIRARL